MAYRLFLLRIGNDQVHAPVVMFAKFPMKHRNQFSEPFAVPRHYLGQQQRIHSRIAFRQIQLGSDPAAFFTS